MCHKSNNTADMQAGIFAWLYIIQDLQSSSNVCFETCLIISIYHEI